MKFILLLSLPLYALDQLTKYLVLQHIDPHRPKIVMPGFFDLVNITNTGAAFGCAGGMKSAVVARIKCNLAACQSAPSKSRLLPDFLPIAVKLLL